MPRYGTDEPVRELASDRRRTIIGRFYVDASELNTLHLLRWHLLRWWANIFQLFKTTQNLFIPRILFCTGAQFIRAIPSLILLQHCLIRHVQQAVVSRSGTVLKLEKVFALFSHWLHHWPLVLWATTLLLVCFDAIIRDIRVIFVKLVPLLRRATLLCCSVQDP